MDKASGNGILEEFRIEFMDCWQRLPNKTMFFVLLTAWLVLFHFFGNATLGYAPTSSLYGWLYISYGGAQGALLESEDGHGVLIPFVVLFLFWLKRRDLIALPLKSWWPGLLFLLLGLLVHLLGFMVQQTRVSIVGLLIGIYGLMGMAWGPRWLRASFFPFFLLGFCVPLGSLSEPITFRLRLLVSQLVELISHLLSIYVIREGTVLKDPTGAYQYEVAAACSGIRSLIATLALSVILAFVSFRKPWKRLLVIASAFPLAIFGNLLRMLSIVFAAEIGGQEWGNYVHEGGPMGIFSLLPYVPAFAGLLLLERYLGDPMGAKPAAVPPETASGAVYASEVANS